MVGVEVGAAVVGAAVVGAAWWARRGRRGRGRRDRRGRPVGRFDGGVVATPRQQQPSHQRSHGKDEDPDEQSDTRSSPAVAPRLGAGSGPAWGPAARWARPPPYRQVGPRSRLRPPLRCHRLLRSRGPRPPMGLQRSRGRRCGAAAGSSLAARGRGQRRRPGGLRRCDRGGERGAEGDGVLGVHVHGDGTSSSDPTRRATNGMREEPPTSSTAPISSGRTPAEPIARRSAPIVSPSAGGSWPRARRGSCAPRCAGREAAPGSRRRCRWRALPSPPRSRPAGGRPPAATAGSDRSSVSSAPPRKRLTWASTAASKSTPPRRSMPSGRPMISKSAPRSSAAPFAAPRRTATPQQGGVERAPAEVVDGDDLARFDVLGGRVVDRGRLGLGQHRERRGGWASSAWRSRSRRAGPQLAGWVMATASGGPPSRAATSRGWAGAVPPSTRRPAGRRSRARWGRGHPGAA